MGQTSATAKPRASRGRRPSEPFDAIAKQSMRVDPWAIVKLLGLSPQGVRIQAYPTDVKTIRREGDAAFLMESKDSGDGPNLVTMEVQSAYKADVEPRMALTRAAFKVDRTRRRQPWRRLVSVLILLRPEADRPGRPYDGHYCDEDEVGAEGAGDSWGAAGERSRVELYYLVIRIWRWKALDLAAMGPGAALLAIFGKMDDLETELPVVVARTGAAMEKARREGTMSLEACEAGYETMVASMERMFPEELVMSVLTQTEPRFYDTPRGQRFLKKFAQYRANQERAKAWAEGEAKGKAEGEAKGKAEGAAEATRRSVLTVGGELLGPAPKWVERRLAKMSSVDDLSDLLKRVAKAASWRELLGK